MYKDIADYVKTCYECQIREESKKNNPIRMIPPMDLFQRWEIDIVGPLLTTEDGNRYIIITVDYFSRWPEAKPLKQANTISVATFIYEEIVCRFGSPKVIQSDQGTYFVNQVIEQLTEKFRIKHSLLLTYHPQSNGLIERFNRTLCEGIVKVADTVLDWNKMI
jgi:transposase InsO family protein